METLEQSCPHTYIYLYMLPPPPFTDPFTVSPTLLLSSQLETPWQSGFSGSYWYLLRCWQDFDAEALVSLINPQVLVIFSLKTLQKPEEVPKETNLLRPPIPRHPKICSLGFGNIFLENLAKP